MSISDFANDLLDSMRAAAADGPKHGIPREMSGRFLALTVFETLLGSRKQAAYIYLAMRQEKQW